MGINWVSFLLWIEGGCSPRNCVSRKNYHSRLEACPLESLLARLALAWCLETWLLGTLLLPFSKWQSRGSMCWNCLWQQPNTVTCAEHLLSFWESRIWLYSRQGWPMRPDPYKNPGPESLMSFPGWQHLTRVTSLFRWKCLETQPVWSHWETAQEACTGLPLTLLFQFDDLAFVFFPCNQS